MPVCRTRELREVPLTGPLLHVRGYVRRLAFVIPFIYDNPWIGCYYPHYTEKMGTQNGNQLAQSRTALSGRAGIGSDSKVYPGLLPSRQL